MEDMILTLSKSLGSFCNHLQSSVDALKQSVDRRPIPLDSASSTFTQCLNRRVSSVSSDLNLLESMSFGTVSFEELLGHCNEVFKKNDSDLALLEDRLKSGFGYVPEMGDEEDEALDLSSPLGEDSDDRLDHPSFFPGRVIGSDTLVKSLEEDPLLDDSISLKRLGISDVSLATLASEANINIGEANPCLKQPAMNREDKVHGPGGPNQPTALSMEVDEGFTEDHLNPVEGPKSVLKVSKDEYEGLPSYIKSLASWEDLLVAVEKINANLSKKDNTASKTSFLQDEISSLELGPKARTYLLLLCRMNHMVVETVDGLISYRIL